MLAKVETALADLIEPNEPLLVAVSGGPDSVAMLDVLVKLGCRVQVCHLNHQLRGAESDRDADFVRELSARHHLPFHIESRAVAADEDSARKERLAFFERVTNETRLSKVALAHTADDQVETFLMRLLRGAGTRGLVGMRPESMVGKIRIIRPLLKVRRDEVLEYLKEHDLPFRVDASNADTRFTRNRVRHELLPLLEREYNPAVREVLLRTAEILQDEDLFLLQHVIPHFLKTASQENALKVPVMRTYPVAVQRRVLRSWLNNVPVRFDQIEAIRQLILSDAPSGELSLSSGVTVFREYDLLHRTLRETLQPLEGRWPLRSNQATVIPELGIRLVQGTEGEKFDADSLGEDLYLRTWRDGDRFQPLGMTQEKKLQDFFVDEKVPRVRRARVPLLCTADGRIVWVVGHRIGDPFKITPQTKRVWQVRVESV